MRVTGCGWVAGWARVRSGRCILVPLAAAELEEGALGDEALLYGEPHLLLILLAVAVRPLSGAGGGRRHRAAAAGRTGRPPQNAEKADER